MAEASASASASASALSLILPSPEACVICLERLTERAVALPCKHDHFDFSCLGTWLNQQRVCPLCKGPVNAIKYDQSDSDAGTIYTLPPPETQSPKKGHYRRHHPYHARFDSYGYSHDSSTAPGLPRPSAPRSHGEPIPDTALSFRRRVYQEQMYSLHVGSNRISRYRNLTPSSFTTHATLLRRASAFVRRELRVFDFLVPSSPTYGSTDRRASNPEFLLDYILSIVKAIDLRGSGGQAEQLLEDFLGRVNARLFLHELEAFLRSPFETLEEWDRVVQYAEGSWRRCDDRKRRSDGYEATNHDR